jgi:hypothetical protein
MKKLFFLTIIWFNLFASAEVITMDLSTAKDIDGNPISYSETTRDDTYYNITDVWDNTYNDTSTYRWIYTNNGIFRLSHIPSQNSYAGMSWEGFTLSKISQDTANVFGCVANGGLGGIATPYVIGYYSEWVSTNQGFSSNIIQFDREYYPEYVYICQNSNTYKAITQGEFNARPFTQNDTLALIIQALDSTMLPTNTTIYYLAVNDTYNNGWGKVPLTDLGKTACISFSMSTTDMGDWGANTPLYFALDALTINTEIPTSLPEISNASKIQSQKILRNNHLISLFNDRFYNLFGQSISTH